MSPSPNWTANDNRTVYHWSDNNGVDVWVSKGHWNRWEMTYTLDHDSPTYHADLGKTRFVNKALNRADDVIGMAYALPSEKEPTWYVLEIDNPNGPGKLYMSREAMENENVPEWDTLDKAAITYERDAHIFASRSAANDIRVVPLEDARHREDLQTVVNLAKETEDRTPEEQASIDRLEESLVMGRPEFPDPSENWLNTFHAEMREREDPIAQQPGVGAALEASDQHRKAKDLLERYFHAETLANTPVAYIGEDSDNPGDEDRYPDVDTQTPYAAFQDHLREHPELEALDEWKVYFQELEKDRDQDKGYEV